MRNYKIYLMSIILLAIAACSPLHMKAQDIMSESVIINIGDTQGRGALSFSSVDSKPLRSFFEKLGDFMQVISSVEVAPGKHKIGLKLDMLGHRPTFIGVKFLAEVGKEYLANSSVSSNRVKVWITEAKSGKIVSYK
jgi:hypothetical protein